MHDTNMGCIASLPHTVYEHCTGNRYYEESLNQPHLVAIQPLLPIKLYTQLLLSYILCLFIIL